MAALGIARLFALKALWWAGASSAGRALLEALGSPEEGVRTVAGMFLVQAGKRAEPLLKQAIEQGRCLPMTLIMAADIGAQDLAPQIRGYTSDPNPQIARAAHDALEILARQKKNSPAAAS